MAYSFNRQGVEAFIAAALHEAMENNSPLALTIGEHKIYVPMLPETYESMADLLDETLEIIEEEFPEEVSK